MKNEIRRIETGTAPRAIGPYSQAVACGNLVFTSGQISIDPATNQFTGGDVSEQTRRALENLKAVLAAAGCGLERVVKTTVYLKDMKDFEAMNRVYAEYFTEHPARATVQAAGLPKNALVEIDCLAVRPD